MTRSSKSYSVIFLSLGATMSLFSSACNAVKTATSPGGRHVLDCPKGMESCISKAGKLCGDEGYIVLSGASRTKLLGGASSSYRSMSQSAELSIQCGGEREIRPEKTYQLPPRTDEPLANEPAVPPASRAICIVGTTQACVGPGGCRGGQVCEPGGESFGVCDCGEASPHGEDTKKNTQDIGTPSEPSIDLKKQSLQEIPGVAPSPAPLIEKVKVN